MQYYTFAPAVDTKETGSQYPQIQKWTPGYDDDKSDSYYVYCRVSRNSFPDFAPDLDSLVMHGWAKPTDLVSSFVSRGFIISERLKLVFEEFRFPPHRFYPAKVIHRRVALEGYYLMDIISDNIDCVDYSGSSFIISGFTKSLNDTSISFSSKEEFLEKAGQLQNDSFVKNLPYRSIKSERICFNENFDRKLDGFEIGRFNIDFFISAALRNALLENNITGCKIEATNHIIFKD